MENCVPLWQATGLCSVTLLPSILTKVPNSSSLRLVFISTCAIAAMEARASPLKPKLLRRNKSSAILIFEVACLSQHMRASVTLMPRPLSMVWMSKIPPSLTMSLMSVAPASKEFSKSSLTTEAGLCTTSPAAIWLAMLSGKSLIQSISICS